MPGQWNLERQQVIGAARSISPGGGQRSEIDLVASLLSLPWPPGRARSHQDGPWLAGRTPVQLQVTAV